MVIENCFESDEILPMGYLFNSIFLAFSFSPNLKDYSTN